MKSIEEVKEYLIKHRTDEHGRLDLSGLEFDGVVDFSKVKAKIIFNVGQTAGRILNQDQEAEDGIYNYYQKAGEEIDNDYQAAKEISNDNQQLTPQRKEYTIKIIATDEQIERIKKIVNEVE